VSNHHQSNGWLSRVEQHGGTVLLFDGACGVCTRFAYWAEQRSNGDLIALPSQLPGIADFYGLTRDDLERAAWTISSQGTKRSGAAAVSDCLVVAGRGWRVVSRLYRNPLLARLGEIGYEWFARHRHGFARFGTAPACTNGRCD